MFSGVWWSQFLLQAPGRCTVGLDHGLLIPRVWAVCRTPVCRTPACREWPSEASCGGDLDKPQTEAFLPHPWPPQQTGTAAQVRGQPEASVSGTEGHRFWGSELACVNWRKTGEGGWRGCPQGHGHPCCRNCLFSVHCKFQAEGGCVSV